MKQEEIYQFKVLALQAVQTTPGDFLGNAELVYQWLTKEAQESVKAAQKARNDEKVKALNLV